MAMVLGMEQGYDLSSPVTVALRGTADTRFQLLDKL